MASAWPGSLPQAPLVATGYTESPPVTTIRTPMDGGVPKVRQRFTAAVRPITWTFHMTKAQVATLDTFFVTTLTGGALPFELADPRTGATEDYRFVTSPTYTPRDTDELFLVACNLELMP